MAHCRYYGDNTGALVDTAKTKHAAHLLHRVTLKRYPEPMAHGPESCEPSHPRGSR